jgi:phage-related protein
MWRNTLSFGKALDFYNKFVIIEARSMANTKNSWQIGFYQDHRGKSPVIDFINALPAKERAKIDIVLQLLGEFGTDLGMPHARPLRDKIWELRPGGIRLLYFAYINRQFVILHSFRKTTNRTPDREIETALRRMIEILEE